MSQICFSYFDNHIPIQLLTFVIQGISLYASENTALERGDHSTAPTSANKIKGTSASEAEAQQLGLGECGRSREARVASSGTYHPHWERYVSSLLLNARAPGTSSAEFTTVPPDPDQSWCLWPKKGL